MDYIKEAVYKLTRKYQTHDPFEIADSLRIHIMMRDFGTLKGMYTVIKNHRYIMLSQNLNQHEFYQVCAHEIGHDILHRKLAKNLAFQEFSLMDMSSRPEYEANVFAAHLLIDEKELREYAVDGYDVWSIAAYLRVDPNLVLIKMNEMNKEGDNFRLPYIPRGDFWR